MQCRWWTVVAVIVVVVVVGFSPAAAIGVKVKITQETLDRIDALTAMLEESLSDFNNALPGGQYMLLIQDLHSGDSNRKAAAQAFLKSLGDLDPETNQYDVSTWFEFESGRSLRAMTFRAGTPSPKEIETRYAQGFLLNPGNVSSTPLRGPTAEEVGADLRKRLETALRNIVGGVDFHPVGFIDAHGGLTGFQAARPLHFGSSGLEQEVLNKGLAEARKKHAKLFSTTVDELSNAFSAFYQNRALPLPPIPQVQQWNLFDDRQVLFIVIPDEDWASHGGQVAVKALIHQRGRPDLPLPGSQLQVFSRDEWRIITVSDAQRPSRTYWWTFRTMTDLQLLSTTTVSRIREAQKALAEWKSLTQSPKKRQ